MKRISRKQYYKRVDCVWFGSSDLYCGVGSCVNYPHEKPLCLEHEIEYINNAPYKKSKGKAIMSSLRSRVRTVLRSKDEQALIDAGFTYESGSVTKEGRQIMADLQIKRDKELRKELIDIAKELGSASK